ncbi:MAG: 23S rRNA (pseudouridine(1915)-N(3))-methyltransferase RlmH [Acidobacteria bacterium]|jgi:23S rRNA (pseudouridine1915-N3)-methyltransferase|nr:23S rRNA (pseudouridine(1915)-N(3))-methyltransferase RlmH [Acidobacteriota bacterium]
MKTVELVCSGELKFKGLQELEKKYLQNINYYVEFSIKKLKVIHHSEEEFVKVKEGALFLREIQPRDYVVALDERGKKMDSRGFAALLQQKISYHPGRLLFLIGGFAGFAPAVVSRADLRLAFSDMTIAHDIFRIVFLEQVYRAMTIAHGGKYHR